MSRDIKLLITIWEFNKICGFFFERDAFAKELNSIVKALHESNLEDELKDQPGDTLEDKLENKFLILLGNITDHQVQQNKTKLAFIKVFFQYVGKYEDHDQQDCEACPQYEKVLNLLWNHSTMATKLLIAEETNTYYFQVQENDKIRITTAYLTIFLGLSKTVNFDSYFILYFSSEIIKKYVSHPNKNLLEETSYLKKVYQEFFGKFTELKLKEFWKELNDRKVIVAYVIGIFTHITKKALNNEVALINNDPLLTLFDQICLPLSNNVFKEIAAFFQNDLTILQLLYPRTTLTQKTFVTYYLRQLGYATPEFSSYKTGGNSFEKQMIDKLLYIILYHDMREFSSDDKPIFMSDIGKKLFEIIEEYYSAEEKNEASTLDNLFRTANSYLTDVKTTPFSPTQAFFIGSPNIGNVAQMKSLQEIMCTKIVALASPGITYRC